MELLDLVLLPRLTVAFKVIGHVPLPGGIVGLPC
jgi:hypothetical protein